MSQQTLTVTGMSCGGCEQAVEDALTDIDGVTSAEADHEGETVAVEADAGVSDADLAAAVEDAGYELPA